MDHFNATVHNGALVSTRKGLLISKSKHQGIRFVNAFASESAVTSPASASANTPVSTPKVTASSNSPSLSSAKRQSLDHDEKPPSSTSVQLGNDGGKEQTVDSLPPKSSNSNSRWVDAAGMTTPSPAFTATTPTSVTNSTNNTATNNSNYHSSNNSSRRAVEEPFTPISNEDISGVMTDFHDEINDDDEIARALLYASDQQTAQKTDQPDNTTADQLGSVSSKVVVQPAQTHATSTFRNAGSHTEVDNPSRYLETVPALTQRLVGQYLNNVPQESHLYEAISVVASLSTDTPGVGDTAPTELAASIASVCSTMNKDFLTGSDGGRAQLTVVLESVAALAIDGVC